MGIQKHEMEKDSGSWQVAAEINDYRCLVCGSIPPLEEREIYFETQLCGWCQHQALEDD